MEGAGLKYFRSSFKVPKEAARLNLLRAAALFGLGAECRYERSLSTLFFEEILEKLRLDR